MLVGHQIVNLVQKNDGDGPSGCFIRRTTLFGAAADEVTLKHSSCNAWRALLFELADGFPEADVGIERILHFHAVERNEVKLRYVATGLLVSKLGDDGLDAGRLQNTKEERKGVRSR